MYVLYTGNGTHSRRAQCQKFRTQDRTGSRDETAEPHLDTCISLSPCASCSALQRPTTPVQLSEGLNVIGSLHRRLLLVQLR